MDMSEVSEIDFIHSTADHRLSRLDNDGTPSIVQMIEFRWYSCTYAVRFFDGSNEVYPATSFVGEYRGLSLERMVKPDNFVYAAVELIASCRFLSKRAAIQ